MVAGDIPSMVLGNGHEADPVRRWVIKELSWLAVVRAVDVGGRLGRVNASARSPDYRKFELIDTYILSDTSKMLPASRAQR